MATVRKDIMKGRLDKSWLDEVPEDKVFFCHDGRVVKNLEELSNALRKMSADTYRYHASREKNDFSSWIRDVIGDATLAGELVKTATNTTAARKVEMRLHSLQASF